MTSSDPLVSIVKAVAGGLIALATGLSPLSAAPVAVRYAEGVLHGFLAA